MQTTSTHATNNAGLQQWWESLQTPPETIKEKEKKKEIVGWGMDTLEAGTLLVDDSDSSATSSPVLFFAFVGVTAEESEICPKHWKITT
jgi:hypothetical protein